MPFTNAAHVIDTPLTENDVINSSVERLAGPARLLLSVPLFLNLFLLPLCMGGVRPTVYQAISCVTYACLFVLIFLPSAQSLWQTALGTPWTKAIIGATVGLAAFIALQIFLLGQATQIHPVLGQIKSLQDPAAAWTIVRGLCYFAATYLLCLLVVAFYSPEKVVSWLVPLTCAICCIAITHWFYDNGKLFWIFAPDNVGIQNRARWPFVNPNHLGHYCLLLCSAIFISLQIHFDKFENSVLKDRDNRIGPIIKRFSHARIQRYCWNLLVSAVVLVTVFVTIFGTLSRSTWLGLSAMVALLSLVLTAKYLRKFRLTSRERRKQTIAQRYKLMARKIAIGVLLIGSIAALFVFLAGRGSELIQERIVYGLTNSRDDLRWLLYGQSKPILFNNLWTGIGAGQWPGVFQQREIPELSGFTPEYLHSDPYQLLLEIGLPAFAVFAGILLYAFIKRASAGTSTQFWIFQACLIGFFTASLLDFPFRIPAINALLACLLALWSIKSGHKTQVENHEL